MKYFLGAFKHYADFRGRTGRRGFWMFILFYFIASVVVVLADMFLLGYSTDEWGVLTILFTLGTFIPSLAIEVRRLHDVGKSGWWVFISLVPVIGGIWLLVLCCMAGQPEANQWGEPPVEG